MIELTNGAALFLNIAVWLLIHLSVSFFSVRMSERFIGKFNGIFASFSWERSGIFYEKIQIRKWKDRLPEAGHLFKGGFSKKTLTGKRRSELERFLHETKRGELSHWLQLMPCLFFFIWNTPAAGLFNVLYAFVFNSPFILIQRYNRIRLRRVLQKKKAGRISEEVRHSSLSSDEFGV
ncbi:glycosyl-4,4'-diaponeurosporenoate acyltransferase [Metabacillus idriensis]|uniref:glycosyl-4,4'-diaponeurosporenoate acyltransferase CrtO family protein n=1 Tax=Metabacillus idriensis TaxID=324768 RepID=UPI00174D57CD|nr:glycosyl-4,4'-diaponeurosporenoate acyltransferase [Metabacillus idriensis]MCM3594656.1 glycosyl-4,4'-diaponeurosporenoate acyltransferase [Metabacillus idriensis]